MKQITFVSALVLILIIAVGGNLSSKMHPDGFQDLTKPNGDDHPWGGEQWTGGDPLKSSQPRMPVITPFPLIDYVFVLYLDWITVVVDESQSKSGANSHRITSNSRAIVAGENIQQEPSIRR